MNSWLKKILVLIKDILVFWCLFVTVLFIILMMSGRLG